MIGPNANRTKRRWHAGAGLRWWALLACLAAPFPGQALPARLVLALDGVAYRDLQSLQAGVTRTNFWGRSARLQAFTADEGYFPVSRMISTFPSASDVAWTDIFGDHPLPGYQRTYYSVAANALITLNGVTTTMEHEHQMDWQVQNGFIRTMGYLFPVHTLRYEMAGLEANFWRALGRDQNYYAYFRATDDSQHLDRDILPLLCWLDQRLQKMRARYRSSTGRDLPIVLLSDHGHNHAGRGIRARERAFLERAGYRVATTIAGPRDVVLPIVGVENWIEVHCDPRATEALAARLCQLAGADVLAATLPAQPNRFLVLNSRGERAEIAWRPADNAFRYAPAPGDPLGYRPVLASLAQNHQLDADGFAAAEAWMAASRAHHYPLAVERIVRGLTRGALNPATILISLDNRYVNDSWLVQQGSRLVSCGSTHGGLDDVCSDGILLSNFAPTRDTSTARVAGQFEDFPAVKNYRAEESGAEWITKAEVALTRIGHDPLDGAFPQSAGDGVYLRMWSPRLAGVADDAPIEVTIEKTPRYSTSPGPRRFTLDRPLPLPAGGDYERVYALPADWALEPGSEYAISGWLPGQPAAGRLFTFTFHTGGNGRPVAY